MSSLDPEALQYLDGAVKATVQERKKVNRVSDLIDQILNRQPLVSRQFLEGNPNLVFELWIKHTNALEDTELPPSPPESTNNVGHRGSNGSSSLQGSAGEDRPIILVEHPEVTASPLKTPHCSAKYPQKTERVSISIHLEKGNHWKGMRGLYGMRKESFISEKIVDRYNLPVEDKKVYLTWVLGDEPNTYKTCFHVVLNDQLSSDCLLGTHCQKGDEENEHHHEDDDERNSEGSPGKKSMNSSQQLTYTH
jgi:hypothetical protein